MGHSCPNHVIEASGQLYLQANFIIRENTPTPKSNSILNGRKVHLNVVAKREIHIPVAYRTPGVGPVVRHISD
jgi:hypothetical protein